MNTTGMQTLTSRQTFTMALMGAVLWLAAALLIARWNRSTSLKAARACWSMR